MFGWLKDIGEWIMAQIASLFGPLLSFISGLFSPIIGFVTFCWGVVMWLREKFVDLQAKFETYQGRKAALDEMLFDQLANAVPGWMADALAFANYAFPVSTALTAVGCLGLLMLVSYAIRFAKTLIPGWS